MSERAEAVEVFGVPGMGEVRAGDDLAALIVTALVAAGEALRDGDVVVVSGKVVSKAQGRVLAADTRDAAVQAETVRVVAERSGPRGVTRVVQSRSGPVLAAAGVDASNVARGQVLLLPADPDADARALRHRLRALGGARVGVIVSDTAGRPWRDGQVDLAIGAAGVSVTDDLRGTTDAYGNPLEATVRAVADELAAAADLVKGKLRGVPVAVVRGVGPLVGSEPADDDPGAAGLLRTGSGDWFALGHVEAVRTALGVPPGTPGVDPAPLLPDDDPVPRLRRAVTVAWAGRDPLGASSGDLANLAGTVRAGRPGQACLDVPVPEGGRTGDLLALGALVQRITAAAWAEGLAATAELTDGHVTVSARLAP